VLVAVLLFITNPVLTHATGQAAHNIERSEPPT
jgi:multisubunit Na+/H+ antiporter MnhG subunit